MAQSMLAIPISHQDCDPPLISKSPTPFLAVLVRLYLQKKAADCSLLIPDQLQFQVFFQGLLCVLLPPYMPILFPSKLTIHLEDDGNGGEEWTKAKEGGGSGDKGKVKGNCGEGVLEENQHG